MKSRPAGDFDLSLVEEKLKGIKTLSDLTGPGGPIQELMKQAVERVLKAEQDAHPTISCGEPSRQSPAIF